MDMSDKSFGDYTNKNIVKNPLLSSAVTGLSLEDLTNKAVLLPVAPSLGQISRPGQHSSQARTLAHSDHASPAHPSGDAFSNIIHQDIPLKTNQIILDNQHNVKHDKLPIAIQSKASAKSDDDFDMNEYIARLQGTRYVSAPLHSHLKEDQSANLNAAEETLEEINLNDSQGSAEVHQSLTADIAQNFSQLPTVLPHVASAVFSSFSSMLSYKSREQTPDSRMTDYQEVQLQKQEAMPQKLDTGVVLMGVEDYSAPKEVAPPPKEPPIGGTSNFRITTKKKYAQIPGLSSGDSQNMTFSIPSHNIPVTQSVPQYFTPMEARPDGNTPTVHNQSEPPFHTPPQIKSMDIRENMSQNVAHNVPPICQSHSTNAQSRPPMFTPRESKPIDAQSGPLLFTPTETKIDNTQMTQKVPDAAQNVLNSFNPIESKTSDAFLQFKLTSTGEGIESTANTQNVAGSQAQYDMFNPTATQRVSTTDNQQTFFTPIEQAQDKPPLQHVMQPTTGGAIIPPPPMFSNLPRRDGQPSVGKSILPPSVARRISANQPLIKPSGQMPEGYVHSTFPDNIFVPPPRPDSVNSSVQTVLHTAPPILDPMKPSSNIQQLQAENNVPSKVTSQTDAPEFLIPSKEDKPQNSAVPIFTPSKEDTRPPLIGSSSNIVSPLSFGAMVPSSSSISAANNPPNLTSHFRPAVPNTSSTPNIGNDMPHSSSIFTPTQLSMEKSMQNIVPPSMFQPPTQTMPPTPSFFNPSQQVDIRNQIMQIAPNTTPEPKKPFVEPPKASGSQNFRMTKRRPQYYAGPIEGVGAISNNVKPVIPSVTPVGVSNFEGALFTPEQPIQPATEHYSAPNIERASVPFDINRPAENMLSQTAFDINKPPELSYGYGSPFNTSQPSANTNYGQRYNTEFDLSRATTESYEPPKQDAAGGFGIIGSLKSKLSSIDINKIQNTVTTFFDPAYNNTKSVEPAAQENISYESHQNGQQQQYGQLPQGQHQQYGQSSQGQSNFEIFVLNVDQSQSNQIYQQTGYDANYQYYQGETTAQNYPQNIYNTTDYFANPSYPTQQTYPDNLHANTQAYAKSANYTQENIPQKENAVTEQERTTKPNISTLHSPNDIAKINSQQNVDQHTTISSSAHKSHENMAFYNPNMYSQDSAQKTDAQKPFHVSSNIFQSSSQENNKSSNVFKPDTFEFQNTSDNSALDTSKYSFLSLPTSTIQRSVDPSAPLLSDASFFDNPQSSELTQFLSKTEEIDNKMANLTISHDNTDAQYKREQEKIENAEFDPNSQVLEECNQSIDTETIGGFIGKMDSKKHVKEELLKQTHLIECISKNDKPILGVAAAPLFGLSTLIADRSKEISELETGMNAALLYDTPKHTGNLFDRNAGANFFENISAENKPIAEIHARIPISGLSITDVKNVLLIEPPQDNLGSFLKRNSSSSKLENVSKMDNNFNQRNENLPSTSFEENVDIPIHKIASGNFFEHLGSEEKLIEDNTASLTKDSLNENRDDEDLSICETCREVSSPLESEKEDLTMHLIDNLVSPIQLSNPVEAPLTESSVSIDERSRFDDRQFAEITKIAEDTIETLHVQLATELLDDEITISEKNDYGWTTEDAAYCPTASKVQDTHQIYSDPSSIQIEHDYGFKVDTDAIGFFENNSMFFDNVPTNASDEIKAEIKNSHEDIVLPKQLSIPSAPPAEDDTKSDETGGLDVHSIEQDAKKDFEEEFIIEPSETDDDKIEFREKRSSEDSTNDTFTNRVEKFQKEIGTDYSIDDIIDQGTQAYGSPPKPMASYFDTGNYAVESHYRNSLKSPTLINTFQMLSSDAMRIPPGFEQEYMKRLSGMSSSSGENRNEQYIPDTTTQTPVTNSVTVTEAHNVRMNVIGGEICKKDVEIPEEPKRLPAFADVFGVKEEKVENTISSECKGTNPDIFSTETTQPETSQTQTLPDPMNFFSTNAKETKTSETDAPESFSRLASYFSMPESKPEHSKSFFELSQGQNHHRHQNIQAISENENKNVTKSFFELSQSQNHYIDDNARENLANLMEDLTSPHNLHVQEQVVKRVNYFTVEYDNDIRPNCSAAPINVKTNLDDSFNLKTYIKLKTKTNLDRIELVGNCKDCIETVANCNYCSSQLTSNIKGCKIRTAMNESSDSKKETVMANEKEDSERRTVTVNFENNDLEGRSQDSAAAMMERRPSSEYTPVRHHWFYRVDVEEKSLWRGFSGADSAALEEAWASPELNENTLVPTDGGRFDVNVIGRLRIAVYWKEKPTNVRRCSWFYKGTTDARYVPYTEAVAEKLEEEYRHGITTGEWHRKLVLPNNEMVIMHGPAVMVHFLHNTATDAFSSPPQATSRPRVVRRGYEESEIEDSEPSSIDHLLLLCHGVGSACDMRFRSVEEVVEDFRSTSLQLLQSHYRNSYDNGTVSRVEVLPISWHAQLHSGETGVDRRLSRVTLDSIPRLRAFTNHTVLDVLFYTSPVFHQTIIETVCSELNRIYSLFKQRNPEFKGGVSLGGHSLGSVILYDLLCHQLPESPLVSRPPSEKVYVPGTAGTGQLGTKYPQLDFPPAALYALGSPIAIFECIRGVESLGLDFALPTCKNFFNIFHPYDPIAYRIEPLINPQLQGVKPFLIPHHKGRKRMHLELKDTMARVGADLKQKLMESLRTTWNKWKSSPPTDGQLEKVVEEEMEKEQLCEDSKEEQEIQATPDMLGKLNSGRRVDYVLQEAPLEMINEYLFAMSSHVGYWESEDTMLLMLREIYTSLGVQPDCTLPQPDLLVQRTRIAKQDEATFINENEFPSTSRGSTS